MQDLLSKHPAFGQVKVDTSSIIIKRDLEHTYHSESYVKEALNESMTGSSSKNASSQHSKDKVLQSRVGVVRKTTVKPNPNNQKKDIEEPDIDTETLPVVQGSFQITKTEADITENKQQSPSPSRNDEKVSQKPVIAKITTTVNPTTVKRVPTTSAKPRPFTILSTLNVKTRTDATPKTDSLKTTRKATTIPTTSTISTLSTTSVATTTSNVSQLLLDLLTNENHYKDLPKIDTLFTVPHVIDNEPWRPITKPYYEITDKPAVDVTMDQAEDRIGVAEVVEDISAIESMLTPIPPVRNRDKVTTHRPPGMYGQDQNLAADVYVPSPVYTSFTLPTYSPPLKNMETLGSSYPKPHPIPVDKISGVVENIKEPESSDEDDGKPIVRPPKDKTTIVALNVMQFDQQDNSTEQIAVEGLSIVKKHDENPHTTSTRGSTSSQSISSTYSNSTSSTSTSSATTTSFSTTSTTSTTPTPEPKQSSVSEEIMAESESESHESVKDQSTRRPNNKVSIIPSTGTPHHTWELVNTSTHENDTFNKHSPEKHYNDTLQAIITKNDATFPNTTPKFPSKISILRNLTDIIKRYTQTTTEAVPDSKAEERQNSNKLVGSSEVVLEEREEEDVDISVDTTTAKIITLLPAKSNLGVNRPLRPRPKIRNDHSKVTAENQRSFFRSTQEQTEEVTTKNYVTLQSITKSVPAVSEIITSSTLTDNQKTDDRVILANVTESMNVIDIHSTAMGSNRLPKKNIDIPLNDNDVSENRESIIVAPVPEGTYRVSYHVTGSVSSKQANKTTSLPAYELPLEPDVVLEIPVNQTNSLTIEKLRQLASLATISDNQNDTLFRAPGGGVISTKAIPSSYTLNQAGFKILTKTYNKFQSTKQDEKNNNFDKNYQDNTYSKPIYKAPEVIEEDNETQQTIKEGKKTNHPRS